MKVGFKLMIVLFDFFFFGLDSLKRMPVDLATSVWREIIHGPLMALIQSEDHHALRSVACNCLTSLAITNESVESCLIFDELPVWTIYYLYFFLPSIFFFL